MVSLSPTLQQRLRSPLAIGAVTLHSRVLQSPLSGVTDRAFRQLVRRYAPDSMLYTEMVQATGLCHAQQLEKIMDIDASEQPISIQLFDCRPDFMAAAAAKAVAEGAKTIDINMGCPVNKITKKGGGSSLLRQPDVAEAIVRTVAAAVPVPVTVKTRIGWDDDSINAIDFARRMEAAGAQMLTLHGRTRHQGYHGPARWKWIAQVKAALSIPVIANGDIVSVESAVRCLEQTGADGVMCSRGTLGYPFLVGEIDTFLKTGTVPPAPTPIDKLRCAREHLGLLWQYKGQKGIYQARKHMAWYVKGFEGAAPLRQRLCQIDTVEAGYALLDGAIAELDNAIAAIERPPSWPVNRHEVLPVG
ncbi:tRNA dihydrouridine synthase DusB [filamentous cyanobacterium CCT1]|nr:tRNA dihydrouridine synthase DusB [filamentous cyanobacterium CCT1]PSN79286.1 tRNA dihydrouridine synthase DusB [filamentous cyanobacterium CCP4]